MVAQGRNWEEEHVAGIATSVDTVPIIVVLRHSVPGAQRPEDGEKSNRIALGRLKVY